jgi:hypothetical protein
MRHVLFHDFPEEASEGWKTTQIASNPFAEQHLQYGPRTTPIVRELVCEDSETALQIALTAGRPLPGGRRTLWTATKVFCSY